MRHPLGAHIGVFLLLLSYTTACTSYTPPVGTITIDTDLPALHEGELPIGITLDMGNEGKDMLSPNLLVNGSFDLAPRLRDGAIDAKAKTVTTPNNYTTYYPLPQYLHGWEPLEGNISLEHGSTAKEEPPSSLLFIRLTARDSIAKIQHTGFALSVRAGDTFTFSCKARSSGGVLKVALVNSSLEVISSTGIAQPLTSEWGTVSTTITASSDLQNATLLITAERSPTEGNNYYQDAEGNWRSIPSNIWLDDCRLVPSNLTTRAGLPTELYELIEGLSPEFVRFPGGRTVNGFYPGTYPLHLDSLEQTPIWTLPGAEYTGDFTYHDLTSLATSLEAVPVLLVNFGFTDPSAQQRIEGLKLIEDRSRYIADLYHEATTPELVIQPGYNLSGTEYTRRFNEMLHLLKRDSIAPQFITGGALTPEKPYSDYTTDLVLPPVERPKLEGYLPSPDSAFLLVEPLILGEVTFAPQDTTTYTLTPLLQRVAFLIEAERYSGAIQGVTLTPLLGSPTCEELPIIRYHAAHYEPTLLYTYLQYHRTWRGAMVRQLSTEPKTTSLYLSLTSDKGGNNYFLKVVNTTRHPLPYHIAFKGLYSNFKRYTTVHYTPERGEFEVEKEQKVPARGLHYTFDPYKIVIFHLKR